MWQKDLLATASVKHVKKDLVTMARAKNLDACQPPLVNRFWLKRFRTHVHHTLVRDVFWKRSESQISNTLLTLLCFREMFVNACRPQLVNISVLEMSVKACQPNFVNRVCSGNVCARMSVTLCYKFCYLNVR